MKDIDLSSIRDWQSATEVASELSTAGSDWIWSLGDICNHLAGIRKTDPRRRVRTLRAFAAAINQPYETLRIAARTAYHVPPVVRAQYKTLTYGHFREIVKKGYTEMEDITLWAERATNNAWGVGVLKDHLYGSTPQLSDARKIVRKINQLSPAVYPEILEDIDLEDLRLLGENAFRISSIVKDFLSSMAAERHVGQPVTVATQPRRGKVTGDSLGGGSPVTPRAPEEFI